MKKLFTLVALLALCFGAQAKVVTDCFKDFIQDPSCGWQSDAAAERISFNSEGFLYSSSAATENNWDAQYWIVGGMGPFEEEYTYVVTFYMKGSVEGSIGNVKLGDWGQGIDKYGAFAIPTDWQEVTVEYTGVTGGDGILVQTGSYVGDLQIQWIKVTHEEEESSQPEEWINIVANGDASAAWSNPDLRITSDDITQAPEGWEDVVAWTKVNYGDDAGKAYPSDIEDGVFVVKAGAKADDGQVWDNQFWICAPKAFDVEDEVKVSFRYKADKPAKVSSQGHTVPTKYLNGTGVGDLNFTTEWQTVEKRITVSGGWHSIAFNLSELAEENTYYFDDIKVETMVLEEGYFVVGSNSATGLAYNFANSIEFEDGEDGTIVATVGTVGNEESWVNEVMISTKRGNEKAFKRSTIKPSGDYIGEDAWGDYVAASKATIKLPAAGVWQITLDTEASQMNIVQLEGDEPQEPIEIKANPTEITVEGVERDWLGTNDDGSNKEEGGVGEGQPWDNQFWILANRALAAGEETYIEFEYKSSVPAKVTTQCQGDIANGGGYMWYAAIGDVNFETEWQTFSKTYTVPSEADGMQSFAFCMAEIKEACTYEIKNVIWCVGSKEASYESLIDMEAANKNFWAKISAGTAPYNWAEGPTGINGVVNSNTGSAAIYNLAGQRVSNTYKGIVVKEGKKYLVK